MVAEGVPHHITQRGNNRQDVFLLDEDRRFYIEALRAKSKQHSLTVLGYCLMTNHVHLVAIPQRATSRAIGQAHWRYKRRFNQKYNAAPPFAGRGFVERLDPRENPCALVLNLRSHAAL